MNVFKSCKSGFIINNIQYFITNTLYKKKFKKMPNGEIRDVFLEDLFENSIVLHYFDFDYENSDLSLNLKIKYAKEKTNQKTYLIKYSTSSFIGISDQKYFNINNDQYTNYLTFICPRHISSGKYLDLEYISNEIIYLKTINADDFYFHSEYFMNKDKPYIKNDYVIIPNSYKNPITEDDKISAKIVKNTNNVAYINNFLYNINFLLIFYNYNLSEINYKILLDLNIKKIIIDFYKKKFYVSMPIDKDMINIYVNTVSKNNIFIINFFMVNYYLEQSYISFIDYNILVKYDTFLAMMKENIDIIYDRISVNNTDIDLFCKNNPLYKIYKKYETYLTNYRFKKKNKYENLPFNNNNNNVSLKEILGLKLGLKYDNIIPLRYNNSSDGIYTYCSATVTCRINDELFEILLKDVTFDYLNSHENYLEEYLHDVQNNIYNIYNVNNLSSHQAHQVHPGLNPNIIPGSKLPQYLEIIIKKLDLPLQSMVRIKFKETYHDYIKKVQPRILSESNIDPQVILGFIIKSSPISVSNEITDILSKNIMFHYFLDDRYVYDDINSPNFYITNKKNYKYAEDKFTLWYIPHIKITDKKLLLKKIGEKILDYNHHCILLFNNFLDNLWDKIKNNIYSSDFINFIRTSFGYTWEHNNPPFHKQNITLSGTQSGTQTDLFTNLFTNSNYIDNIKKFISVCFKFFFIKINKYITPQLYSNSYIYKIYNKLYYDILVHTNKNNSELFELALIIFDNNIYNHLFDNLESYIRKDKNMHEIINLYTDFYVNFRKGKYIKNIRDLTPNLKYQIDSLLNNFMLFHYNDLIENSKNIRLKLLDILKSPYHVYAHYPNSNNWSIFHMHIINSKDIIDSSLQLDIYNNYYGLYINRIFSWNFLKYIDYSKSTIDLVYNTGASDIKLAIEKLNILIKGSGRSDLVDVKRFIPKIINANNNLH